MTIMDSMDDLILRFKAESAERMERIEELLTGLTEAGDAAERCDAIREEAHKLKGAAGVLGYPEMKESASELEEVAAGFGSGSGYTANGSARARRDEDPAVAIAQAVEGLKATLP